MPAPSQRNVVGPRSPFRSTQRPTRIHAAHQMIDQRQREIKALNAALDRETDAKKRKTMTKRLLATMHNLRSWEDYVAKGSVREPRAVMGPTAA